MRDMKILRVFLKQHINLPAVWSHSVHLFFFWSIHLLEYIFCGIGYTIHKEGNYEGMSLESKLLALETLDDIQILEVFQLYYDCSLPDNLLILVRRHTDSFRLYTQSSLYSMLKILTCNETEAKMRHSFLYSYKIYRHNSKTWREEL